MLELFGGRYRLRTCRIDSWPRLHQDGQVIHRSFTRQHTLVMGREFCTLQNVFFDLRGKHIDAAHDHHVVTAACDFFHTTHGACGAW